MHIWWKWQWVIIQCNFHASIHALVTSGLCSIIILQCHTMWGSKLNFPTWTTLDNAINTIMHDMALYIPQTHHVWPMHDSQHSNYICHGITIVCTHCCVGGTMLHDGWCWSIATRVWRIVWHRKLSAWCRVTSAKLSSSTVIRITVSFTVRITLRQGSVTGLWMIRWWWNPHTRSRFSRIHVCS